MRRGSRSIAEAPLFGRLALLPQPGAQANPEVPVRITRDLQTLTGADIEQRVALVGYVAGVGRAVDQVADFEFHRLRHIRDEDRQDLSLM